MRIAAAQVRPVALDVAANVAEASRIVLETRADLIVFPELSLTGYDLEAIRDRPDLHVPPDDPRLAPLREACAAVGCVALVGAPVPTAAGLVLGAVIVASDGASPRVYAKAGLDDAEAEVFVPGPGPRTIRVGQRTIGLGLCVEASTPEHAAVTRGLGAEIYAVGSLFPLGSERLRSEGLASRARETGMWVIGAQPSGRSGTFDTAGMSGIWSPDGTAAALLGADAPAVATAEIPDPRPRVGNGP